MLLSVVLNDGSGEVVDCHHWSDDPHGDVLAWDISVTFKVTEFIARRWHARDVWAAYEEPSSAELA